MGELPCLPLWVRSWRSFRPERVLWSSSWAELFFLVLVLYSEQLTHVFDLISPELLRQKRCGLSCQCVLLRPAFLK